MPTTPPSASGASSGHDASERSLATHHAALTFFAEAVAGRQVPIEGTEGATWPRCPMAPDAASIVVPARLVLDGEPGRRRHRAMVLHQAVALADADGYRVDPLQLADRHARLPDVFAILEDHRVVHQVGRRFPGAAADIQHALADARADRDAFDAPAEVSALRDHTLGAPVPSGVTPAIERALRAVEGVAATRRTSVAAAIEFCDALEAVVVEGVAIEAEDGETAVEPPTTSGGASPNPDGTIAAVTEVQGLAGGHALDDAELPASESDGDGPSDDVGGIELPPMFRDDPARPVARTFLYDEWDFRAQQHRPAWCQLTERKLQGDDAHFIDELRMRHRDLRREIRRRLAQLRPERLVRVHRSETGDELDLDAVVEAVADRRAGAPVDDRLHIRRDRAERDVATAFLVDLSASTSSPVAPPEPAATTVDDLDDDPLAPLWVVPDDDPEPPRRVIDVAVDAVGLMSDALGELGDPHAIYGFSGTGRLDVDFVIAKDFGDAASPATWAGLAAMRPMRYTRMGPALRHATMRLAAEQAETRLLIMVSDGYPQDVDYGRDARDREHGLYDTARALEDAHRRGIDTFCVTIDPAGHDYLRDMCPDRRYLVIDDVETLPAELAKVWLALRTG